MSAYWVTFNTATDSLRRKSPCCIEAKTIDDAKAEAELMGEVATIKVLPYPAEPNLSKNPSGCPEFCHDPARCQGSTCCPKSYACSE